MGYTCGLCKPRYLRHVDDVYPRDPKDEKLIRSDMDKVRFWVSNFEGYFCTFVAVVLYPVTSGEVGPDWSVFVREIGGQYLPHAAGMG